MMLSQCMTLHSKNNVTWCHNSIMQHNAESALSRLDYWKGTQGDQAVQLLAPDRATQIQILFLRALSKHCLNWSSRHTSLPGRVGPLTHSPGGSRAGCHFSDEHKTRVTTRAPVGPHQMQHCEAEQNPARCWAGKQSSVSTSLLPSR